MKIKLYRKTPPANIWFLIFITSLILVAAIYHFIKDNNLIAWISLGIFIFLVLVILSVFKKNKNGDLEEYIFICEKYEILEEQEEEVLNEKELENREPTEQEIQTAKDIKENLEDFALPEK